MMTLMDTKEKAVRTFAKNVRYMCRKNGKSIGDVEKYAHVSLGYISRCEHSENYKGMGLGTAALIAEGLGMDLSDLLNENLYLEDKIAGLEQELKMLKEQRGAQ